MIFEMLQNGQRVSVPPTVIINIQNEQHWIFIKMDVKRRRFPDISPPFMIHEILAQISNFQEFFELKSDFLDEFFSIF